VFVKIVVVFNLCVLLPLSIRFIYYRASLAGLLIIEQRVSLCSIMRRIKGFLLPSLETGQMYI
jgi:hypothetical protein